MKTFKYRLYPTKAQATTLNKFIECCRWVYNKSLETKRDTWNNDRERLSCYDLIKMIPQWKNENIWLKECNAQVLQESVKRLDRAFESFFRRIKKGKNPGYPRFKSEKRYKSLTYPQAKNWRIQDKHIRLSKIGVVKIKIHRPLEGKQKTLTIKRDSLGKWWAIFICDVENNALPANSMAIGIDLGLEKFVTFSNGETIQNPRFYRKEEKELTKAQRKLSQLEPKTMKYRKQQRVICHIHTKISNKRDDFLHKLSRKIVDENQIIVFENLDIQKMQSKRWRGLNKSISDAGWAKLVTLTKAKAEWAMRTVITVNPRNTSKICSCCGKIIEKKLSCRTHKCTNCGLEMDRDLNAAINILTRGLTSLGTTPESLYIYRGTVTLDSSFKINTERE